MRNALTVDVEDYYQVSAFESSVGIDTWSLYESRVDRNTRLILDLLDEHKVKATFFILGWVAEREPKLVKAIHKLGHEVASHGYSHQLVYHQTPTQFREETKRSKQILEDVVGEEVIGYRAASYSITKETLWALDILIDEGFLYDSSIFPVWHDRYGIPDSKRFFHKINRDSGAIQEFPLSTRTLLGLTLPFGGGGYLRLYPYFVTKWAIKRLNSIENRPAVVYTHPWEFDPKQPRMKGDRLSEFRHYVNIRKTEGHFKTLLDDFQFAPLRSFLPT